MVRKRLAAHYLFLPPGKVLKLRSVELDEANRICGIFPLDRETASTTFFNGILLFTKQEIVLEELLQTLKEKKQQHPEATVFQLLENRHFPEIGEEDAVFFYNIQAF
ncbi:MAG: hypothetical protein LBO74_05075 [Candidatus Symbiothrix sp.]|jgi:hypothetical protein|nr:hypothetical protein [Candidatus Symbiothrix sp.]